MMMYLYIVAGLVLLFFGGEALVRGAVSIARSLRVSELIIGAVLVGFGTSMPEMVTSLEAIQMDAVGIAVGNVVGSNIANILLVLGVAALLSPIVTHPSMLARDTTIMILVTIGFCVLLWIDMFTREVGIGMVALLALYIVGSILLDRRGSDAADLHADEAEAVDVHDPLILSIPIALAGVAGVIFGAKFLVEGGVDLARTFGVSETVIGLSIVAIGTSLPELATSAVSALKGKSDVALGNVLGSNIFNILFIIGVAAIIHPFSVFQPFRAAEGFGYGEGQPADAQGDVLLPIISWEHIGALILSVFLLLLFAFTGRKLSRWEGAVMLVAYGIYLGMVFDFVPTLAR